MTINDMFAELLIKHMRRIRASAAGVAAEIGLSREAVNNWRNGYSRPSRRHRDKLVACAHYLRLTEDETNELLAAAGFEAEYLTVASERLFATQVQALLNRLGKLGSYPIMLLLSQSSWGQLPIRDELIEQAREIYGGDQVLHLQPPYSLSTDPNGYFSALGEQCGFGPTSSDFEFEGALLDRIQANSPVFLLVSRFEQGVPALRTQLAGILRSLSEEYPGQLHLVLCGGEQLAELKYASGDLSLLNIADVRMWPELQAADLQRLAKNRSMALLDSTASKILTDCGGHNGLMIACLEMLEQNTQPEKQRWDIALAGHDSLWQAIVPMIGKPENRDRLAELVQDQTIGPARPYLVDPLLRDLFWRNLIANIGENGHLQWRCPAIRQTVEQILQESTGLTE